MAERLIIFTEDNNGRRANVGFWIPTGTAPTLALSYANALRNPLAALTRNRITGAEYVVRFIRPDRTIPPLAGAESRRSATLFYSTASDSARLILPSPVPQLVETTGPLAGFRVTRESAAAAGLLDELELIVSGTVQLNGEPWPASFDVGSIDEKT